MALSVAFQMQILPEDQSTKVAGPPQLGASGRGTEDAP